MPRTSKKKPLAVTGPWFPFPLEFLRSRACAELSALAAKLFLDVLSMLGPNATRNGDISLAPKVMAIRGWTSRSSLGAATRELLDYGLIVQTRKGSSLNCSLFACTLFPLDCDLTKLDVKPGCYLPTEYRGEDGALSGSPSEQQPAVWRRARKLETASPPRDKR